MQVRSCAQWWLDLPVRAKGLIVIAVPLIALAGAISANLVLEHSERQARGVVLAEHIDIAALALGLLAGLLGVALFTSGISRRVAVAAANADRLGQGRSLEPAGAANDELGRLAGALARADELLAGRDARQVKARLALLAAVVDSTDDAIISKDADGLITSWNPAAERIYGYSAAEIIGQHITLLLADDRRDDAAEILAAFAGGQGGRASQLYETVCQRKDGTAFPASVTISAMRDDDGAVIGTSTIARDATEQRRAEAERRRRTDDLERANGYLETFTYSVAHDLRAPLRTLSGFSTSLLEEYGDQLDEAGRGYAQRIDAAAERVALLVDDLLRLSRLWRTEIQNVQVVDLSAAAGRHRGGTALRHAGPPGPIRHPGRSLRAGRPGADSHGPAESAGERLEVHRQPGRGADRVRGQAGPGRRVCCYVRDNGAGFDPQYVNKLFRPFKRLHPMREFPGTGVGLASVRQIVERHGGRVWAESAIDAGATFYFTLDVRESA